MQQRMHISQGEWSGTKHADRRREDHQARHAEFAFEQHAKDNRERNNQGGV
jgi:hypothetical protein